MVSCVVLAALLVTHPGRYVCNLYPNCDMCNRNHLIHDHGINTSGMYGSQLRAVHSDLHSPKVIVDSTPIEVVREMLRIAALNKDDLLYDIGCGDGRVLIEASKITKKVYGIEIKPEVVRLARSKLMAAGLSTSRVIEGDAVKYDLHKATVVTMYLFPETMEKIIPKLGACRIVSYGHKIPGYKNVEYKFKEHVIYFVDLSWKSYTGYYDG